MSQTQKPPDQPQPDPNQPQPGPEQPQPQPPDDGDDDDEASLETYESIGDAPVDDVTEEDDRGDAGPAGIEK